MKIEIAKSNEDIEKVIPIWLETFTKEKSWVNPFGHPTFVTSYYNTICKGNCNTPLLLWLHENNELKAIIPLEISIKNRKIFFVGGDVFADYQDWVIVNKANISQVVDLVFNHLDCNYTDYVYEFQRIKSSKLATSLTDRINTEFELFNDETHCIELANFSNVEDYLIKVSGKKFLFDTVRLQKKLIADYKSEFYEYYTYNHDVEDVITFTINELKNRYIRKAAPDLTLVGNYVEFIRQLVCNSFKYNNSATYALITNEKEIIATHIGFSTKTGVIWILPAYSRSFKQYGPGRVLLIEVVKRCLNRKINTIDLTWGNDDYKFKLKTNSYKLYKTKNEDS